MSLKSIKGNTCVWCDLAITLEEKITGLKSLVGKTCVWCAAAVMAALLLLMAVWTMLIINV